MRSSTIISIVFIIISVSLLPGQIIVKDERIRFAVGVAGMTDGKIGTLGDVLQDAVPEYDPSLEITKFEPHIFLMIEYEKEVSKNFSYTFLFQYQSSRNTSTTRDKALGVEQGLNEEFQIFEVGFNLIYYIPFINIGTSETAILLGLGPDLSYTEVESFYFLDQRPAYIQAITAQNDGVIFGGKFFAGLDIPFVNSLFFQIRAGFSYRPERKLTANVDEQVFDNLGDGESVVDPAIFEENALFDFSHTWIMVSLAYRF
jgi:hypothetical protein